MKSKLMRTVAAATAVAGLSAVAACGGGSSEGGSAAHPAEVTFWGWAPGYADAVKAFNASHDDVKVTFQEVVPGSKGGYDKMLNAVKAGNAPCLGQVGYETLPSFVAQGALEDITSLASPTKAEFVPGAWSAVSVGDKVYGAPVDTGPVALFYRTDVFKAAGLQPPTTWAEFEKAGEVIHKADPKHFLTTGPTDYDYAGLAQQAGAPWFSIDGDSWKVSVDSAENQKLAAYWQGLKDKDLISPAPMWDQSWNTALGDGSIAAQVGAAWMVGILKGSAAAGSGKWAVAPMPQWNDGDTAVSNVGGSSTAVLKGCDDTKAAWEFAHWMSTDADNYAMLIDKAGLYPAAADLLDIPALQKGEEYFGGQKIWSVFAAASKNVVPGWTWGPNMTATVTAFDDGIGKAWSGKDSVANTLKQTQAKTVDALKQQGLSVKE